MLDSHRDHLMKLARRIHIVADTVRFIHNEVGLPLSLSQALENLRRAKALLLEAAQS